MPECKKYAGYVSDECSWGVTVNWTYEPDARVEEIVVNDFGTWDEINEMSERCCVAESFGEYCKQVEEECSDD